MTYLHAAAAGLTLVAVLVLLARLTTRRYGWSILESFSRPESREGSSFFSERISDRQALEHLRRAR